MAPAITLCELGTIDIEEVETYSAFCLKARRALNCAGLSFASRRGTTPMSFKSINPAGQVPILLVGDEVVCDSTNILDRIEQMVPGGIGKRLSETERAEAWLWEEFADSALSGFVIAAAWCDDANWPAVNEAYLGTTPWFVRELISPMIRRSNRKLLEARDFLRAGDTACWNRFAATLNRLEQRAPESGYWIGETISRADLAIFAQLQSLRAPIFGSQRAQLNQQRRLLKYLDRVDAATRSPANPVAPSST